MACGSRPVEDDPEPGAFPAVGTRSGPGLSRGGLFPLDPPPLTAGRQDAIADQAEPDLGFVAISANPPSRQRAERTNRHRLINEPIRAENGGLRSTQPTLPDGGNRRLNHTQAQSRLLGRVEGRMEPVRGQDDRKRERHARDGVWLPAGGRRPGARGFPGSRHTPRPGVKGAWPYAPLPPPPSGRLANRPSRPRAERPHRHRLIGRPPFVVHASDYAALIGPTEATVPRERRGLADSERQGGETLRPQSATVPVIPNP
jgi:hypothetical protein